MLVPMSNISKEEAYRETFKKWVERNPSQKYLFCEHGKYWGANGCLKNYLKNCEECE